MNYLYLIVGRVLAAMHLHVGWSSEDTVKVFITAGQSNMEGEATNALLERQASNPRFKEFWAP